jgi:hypothetical protein
MGVWARPVPAARWRLESGTDHNGFSTFHATHANGPDGTQDSTHDHNPAPGKGIGE